MMSTHRARLEMETPGADLWVDPAADAVSEAVDAFHAALGRAAPEPCGQQRFALPGYDLKVSAIGSGAAAVLTAAFGHLETDVPAASAPQLEWRIGDAALIGGLPDLPAPSRPLHPLGSLHRNASNDVLIERRRGFVTVFELAALRLTTIVDGIGSIDTDLAAKPLLRFLLPLLLKRDIVLCHAALVGGLDRGLLVTGQGGVGKSTIAAAAITGGAGFCSDDFVALQWSDGQLIGHCVYATLMLTTAQMRLFPTLAAHALRYRIDAFDKHMVPLARHFPAQVRRSLRVDGVAVPEIVAPPSSCLVPGKRSAMLRAITPSSVVASPWREAERTRFLFDHVATLEPLIYQSGSDFSAISLPLKDRYGF